MSKLKHNDKVIYQSEDEDIYKTKKKCVIDKNYKYIHTNFFYRFFSFVIYRILFMPFCFTWFKLFKRIKYKNTKILKSFKKTGYFIYGNHTSTASDGISPTFICFPKKPSIIVNSDNLCTPFVGKLLPMMGAIPLPDDIDATKNFYKAIEDTINHKNPVVIYPEAHLWPYYTKIRDFSDKSFRYPIKYDKPVFCFTTTYTMRKPHKKPKITIYVDGPFYHDKSLPTKLAQQKLRDQIYNKMNERASLSNYEYVKYIKGNDND